MWIKFKEKWIDPLVWIIIIIVLLLSDCTNAPNGAINIPYKEPIRYELIEPLGTKHLYKKEPIVGKYYYCLIHEVPEIIWEDNGVKKVRTYRGPKFR